MKLTRGQFISLFSGSDPHILLSGRDYLRASGERPLFNGNWTHACHAILYFYKNNWHFTTAGHLRHSNDLPALEFWCEETTSHPSFYRRSTPFQSSSSPWKVKWQVFTQATMHQWAGSQPFTIWMRVGQLKIVMPFAVIQSRKPRPQEDMSRCVLAAYLTILHRNKYSEFSINSRDGIGIGIEYPYCLCLSKRGDFTNMNECTPPSLSSTSGFDVGCEFNERTLLLLFFVARRMNAF